MTKYFWVLLALCFSPAVMAIGFLFPIEAQDQSLRFLGLLFGKMTQLPLEGDNAILPDIFRHFSLIALSLALIIVVYTLFTAVLNTAQEGKVMGSKFSVIFTPLRSILGITLLMPSASGYCWIQIIFMWVVINGIGAANGVWGAVIDAYDKGISISRPPAAAPGLAANASEAAQNLFTAALATQYLTLVSNLPSRGNKPDSTASAADKEAYRKLIPGINANFISQTPVLYPGIISDPDTKPPITMRFYSTPDDDPSNLTIISRALASDFTPTIKALILFYSPGGASANALPSTVVNALPNTATFTDDKIRLLNFKLQRIQLKALDEVQKQLQLLAAPIVQLVPDYLQYEPVRQYINLKNAPIDPLKMIENMTKLGALEADPNVKTFLLTMKTQNLILSNGLYKASKDIERLLNPQSDLYSNFYSDIPGYGASQSDISSEARHVGWAFAGAYYYKLASVPPPPSAKPLMLQFDINQKHFADTAEADNTLIDCNINADSCDALNYFHNTVQAAAQSAGSTGSGDNQPVLKKSESAFSTLTDSRGGSDDDDTQKSLTMMRGFGEKFSGLYQSILQSFTDFVNDPKQDPLMSIGALGSQIMGDIEIFFFSFLAAMVLFGLTGGGACLAPVFLIVIVVCAILMPVVAIFITMLWSLAGVMAVYYPMVPYIIYLFTVFGWMMIVLEGIVAAPLIAIAITVPSEDDVGKAGAAVTQWIAVFIRPALTVIGFILGARLFLACIQFMGNTFLATLTAQLPGSSIFAVIPIMALTVSMIGVIVQRCFSATYIVPDQVIRWIGGTPDDSGVGEALSESKSATSRAGDTTGKVVKAGGQAMSSGVKDVGEQAAMSAAKGGA